MKKVAPLLIIVVIIGVIIGIEKNKKSSKQSATQNQEQKSAKPAEQSGTALEGTLQKSNNLKLGNLMLVRDNQPTVYLHTSRDFSSLIGKRVMMSFEGTQSSFTLKDIIGK